MFFFWAVYDSLLWNWTPANKSEFYIDNIFIRFDANDPYGRSVLIIKNAARVKGCSELFLFLQIRFIHSLRRMEYTWPILSETKLKGITLNNVQVCLFTFGVKYEWNVNAEHTITRTEQDVLIWHFLYLHRIDLDLKRYFIYVNTFAENNLNRGCFGLIELESFALHVSSCATSACASF